MRTSVFENCRRAVMVTVAALSIGATPVVADSDRDIDRDPGHGRVPGHDRIPGRDRLPGSDRLDSMNLRLLLEALDNVLDCRLIIADYKIRTVLPSVRYDRDADSVAIASLLERTHDVLNDYRLNERDKVELATESLVQAITLMISNDDSRMGRRNDVVEAEKLVRLSLSLVKSRENRVLESVVRDAIARLRACGHDDELRAAVEVLERALQIACDRRLSEIEKRSLLRDTLSTADQLIRSSRAFMGGGVIVVPPPRPPVPPRPPIVPPRPPVLPPVPVVRFMCTATDHGFEEHRGGHKAVGLSEHQARESALRECLSVHGRCDVRCEIVR